MFDLKCAHTYIYIYIHTINNIYKNIKQYETIYTLITHIHEYNHISMILILITKSIRIILT